MSLDTLSPAIEVWAMAFVLILVRVATFVTVLPLFGGKNLPRIVKLGLSLALAAMWFSSYGIIPAADVVGWAVRGHWFAWVIAVVREAIFGAVLGFGFGLLLLPVRIAGSYVGQEMGLGMASLADPAGASSSNVVSLLFESLAILLFFSLDIHHLLLAAVHVSFARWPIGGAFLSIPIEPLVAGTAHAHEWGLLLAAPLGICLFVTLIVLLLLAKASPQFNLFSVGLSVRLGAGLLAALFFLPDICLLTRRVFAHAIGFVYSMLQLAVAPQAW